MVKYALILMMLFLVTPAWPLDSIVFKGSAMIEDAYILSGSNNQNNYGQVTYSTVNVADKVGPAYSNTNSSLFRAMGLDDSLDAHSGTADSGNLKLTVYTHTKNDTTAGTWFSIAATGIDAAMDWIAGDNAGTAAVDECCDDSAVKIGVGGSGPGIDWGGCRAAPDTMGVPIGITNDVDTVWTTTVNGTVFNLGLSGTQIEAMRSAGANNGWAVMVYEKPGNISITTAFYGSQTTVSGYDTLIPVITIYYTAAGSGAVTKKLGNSKLGNGKW